jgi:hypothetical protein
MIDLQRKNERAAQVPDAGGRIARAAGRLALWGCVLLLLIRGIAAVLASPPQPARTPAPITVTQPATPAPPAGRR